MLKRTRSGKVVSRYEPRASATARRPPRAGYGDQGSSFPREVHREYRHPDDDAEPIIRGRLSTADGYGRVASFLGKSRSSRALLQLSGSSPSASCARRDEDRPRCFRASFPTPSGRPFARSLNRLGTNRKARNRPRWRKPLTRSARCRRRGTRCRGRRTRGELALRGRAVGDEQDDGLQVGFRQEALLDRLELAVDPDHGRRAHLQVKVAPSGVDDACQQFVQVHDDVDAIWPLAAALIKGGCRRSSTLGAAAGESPSGQGDGL